MYNLYFFDLFQAVIDANFDKLFKSTLDLNVRLNGDAHFYVFVTKKENSLLEYRIVYKEEKEDQTAYELIFEGLTLLHLACIVGDYKIVSLLLEKGVDVNNNENNLGFSPLHIACQTANLEIVKLLLERGASKSQVSLDGSTPFWFSCANGDSDIVSLLLGSLITGGNKSIINKPNNKGISPLGIAVYNRCSLVVDLLLKEGANINQSDKLGLTILHHACISGKLDIVHELILNGASIYELDKKGHTPFWFACSEGHFEMVDFFLGIFFSTKQKEKFIGKNSHDGISPFLISLINGHLRVAELLLKNGVDIDEEDDDNCTPLQYLFNRCNFASVRFLIEHGANMNNFDIGEDSVLKHGNSSDRFKILGYFKSIQGESALHIACRYRNFELLHFLISNDFDINFTNFKGQTALWKACFNEDYELVRLLIRYGADKDKADILGNTPLHVACARGNLDIVKYLLEQGVNYNKVNYNWYSPFHAAINGDILDDFKEFFSISIDRSSIVNCFLVIGSDLSVQSLEGVDVSGMVLIGCTVRYYWRVYDWRRAECPGDGLIYEYRLITREILKEMNAVNYGKAITNYTEWLESVSLGFNKDLVLSHIECIEGLLVNIETKDSDYYNRFNKLSNYEDFVTNLRIMKEEMNTILLGGPSSMMNDIVNSDIKDYSANQSLRLGSPGSKNLELLVLQEKEIEDKAEHSTLLSSLCSCFKK